MRSEACGSCALVGGLSEDGARACARQTAREEALRAAGVPVRVSANRMLTTAATERSAQEIFLDVSRSELLGGIVHEEVLRVDRSVDAFGNFEIDVCIAADVVVYASRPDPAFSFEVAGLQSMYSDGGELQFEVTGASGHLQVFLVEGETVARIHPSASEPAQQLKSGVAAVYPRPEFQMRYGLYRDGKDVPRQLVFLFTRAELLPIAVTEATELEWTIAGVEPAERHVVVHPFAIVN